MKKIIPVCLFWAFAITLPAQELNQHWATELINEAGLALEELAVVIPHQEGSLVAGKSASALGYDMYVAAYDANGALLWEEYIDTPNNSEFTHMVADGNGNYYLLGFEVLGAFFSRSVHLAKINSAGAIQWHTVYSGPENIHAWAKDIVLSDGKLHICGLEDQPDGFDSGFVAQFDLDGNLLWDNDFNPSLGNDLTSITVSPNGNVTAAGYADGEFSLYAIQYDSNGNINWTFPEIFEGDDEKWFSDITSDEDGFLYTLVTVETGFFEQSVLTQKRTNDFDLVWEQTFNTGELNEGLSISIGGDLSVYAFIEEESNFDLLARVVKISSTGEEIFNVYDEIDDGSSFVKGVLGQNDQVFTAMRALGSFWISSYTASGSLIETAIYDQSPANYLRDIAVSGQHLLAVGTESQGLNSGLLSLNTVDLSEDYFITTSGEPMPDARPGEITAEDGNIWLSTFGISAPTGTFAISKIDAAGSVVWEHSISLPSVAPKFLHLAPDGNGNIIGLYQNGQNIQTGYYGLMKLDSDGNEVFNTYMDDAPDYIASALCTDNDGNSYVAGYNQTEKLMFLERYDSDGSLQWHVDYESPSPTFPFAMPFDIQYTAQGKLVIGASHKGANEINDLHLFQYLTDGTLDWHEDVINQGGSAVVLLDMEIDVNGDIYIFGSSGFGYVAAKFLPTGTSEWTYSGSTSATQAPRSMARDMEGNLYLTLSSASNASFIKLSPSGNLLVENSVTTNSTGAFYFSEESEIIDNKLVVLGDHLNAAFGTVSFQMVLSSNLEPMFIAIDSLETADIFSSSLDGDGNIYGAYMTGTLSLGKGARSAIVKKFSMEPLGLKEHRDVAEIMTIYPNPTSGDFELAFKQPQPGSFQISIRDIQGRLVHRFTPQSASPPIPLRYSFPNGMSRGIHLIELQTADTRRSQPIILE